MKMRHARKGFAFGTFWALLYKDKSVGVVVLGKCHKLYRARGQQ